MLLHFRGLFVFRTGFSFCKVIFVTFLIVLLLSKVYSNFMPRPKKSDHEKLGSITLRLDQSHLSAIEEAAKKFNLPKSEIYRITSKAGLKALERMSPTELTDYIAKKIK